MAVQNIEVNSVLCQASLDDYYLVGKPFSITRTQGTFAFSKCKMICKHKTVSLDTVVAWHNLFLEKRKSISVMVAAPSVIS